MWRRWLWVIVTALAIIGAITVAEVFTLAPNGYPQRQSYSHNQYQPIYASTVQLVTSWWNGFRAWFDHDAVTTIAIAATAVFTGTLWAATRKLGRFAHVQASDMQSLLTAAHNTAAASASQVRAIEAQERVMREQAQTMAENLALTKTVAEAASVNANAALDQVRIMIARESPVPYLTNWRLHPLKDDKPFVGLLPGVDYMPALDVKNVGKSSLQILAVCMETVFAESPAVFPETPMYGDIIPIGTVIGPDEQTPLKVARIINFTDKEVSDIRNRERFFWLYGFVRYYNQYLHQDWDAGFSVVIYADGGWVAIGLPNYAYHRRHEPNSDTSVSSA